MKKLLLLPHRVQIIFVCEGIVVHPHSRYVQKHIYKKSYIFVHTNHKVMHVENRCRRKRATRTSSRRSAHRRVQLRLRRELNEDASRADVPHADGQVQRAVPSPPRYRSCVRRARDAPHTSPLRAARMLSFPFKGSSIFDV